MIFLRRPGSSSVQSPIASLPDLNSAAVVASAVAATSAPNAKIRGKDGMDRKPYLSKTFIAKIWISDRFAGMFLDLSFELIAGAFCLVLSTRFHWGSDCFVYVGLGYNGPKRTDAVPRTGGAAISVRREAISHPTPCKAFALMSVVQNQAAAFN